MKNGILRFIIEFFLKTPIEFLIFLPVLFGIIIMFLGGIVGIVLFEGSLPIRFTYLLTIFMLLSFSISGFAQIAKKETTTFVVRVQGRIAVVLGWVWVVICFSGILLMSVVLIIES